ncbi:MAG: MiaE family protein [Planctomycetota bacterium]|jgi:tRNA-(ms[2]io[6]A)-hydroxylase
MMFKLLSATRPAWLDLVLPHLDQLVLEQAHLERKAAAGAVTLTFQYPDQPQLHRPLLALAQEELGHFELTMQQLERRGVPYGPIHPSPYAERLLQIVRGVEPQKLLDKMMCNAVIEARSCERMKLLGEALQDLEPELADFYLGLVASEARHHGLYLELARGIFSRSEVDERLARICRHEAAVLERAPAEPRLHN